jgi:hypothetical protein
MSEQFTLDEIEMIETFLEGVTAEKPLVMLSEEVNALLRRVPDALRQAKADAVVEKPCVLEELASELETRFKNAHNALANAELGALVRRMNDGWILQCCAFDVEHSEVIIVDIKLPGGETYRLEVQNDGTGTDRIGNYNVRLVGPIVPSKNDGGGLRPKTAVRGVAG